MRCTTVLQVQILKFFSFDNSLILRILTINLCIIVGASPPTCVADGIDCLGFTYPVLCLI